MTWPRLNVSAIVTLAAFLLLAAACGGDITSSVTTVEPSVGADATQIATPMEPVTPEQPTLVAAVTPTITETPAASNERPTTAEVVGSSTCLNVRSAPVETADILGCYPDTTVLRIWGDIEYGYAFDWLAVETESGDHGWAAAKYLNFDSRAFPASYAVPVHPIGIRTGVAVVDALIDAVHSRDAERLADMIVPVLIPCTHGEGGIGGPPLCQGGEEEGTKIAVLTGSQCHGFEWRVEDIGAAFPVLVRGAPRVFAVYETEPTDSPYIRGEFEVVFALANGWARSIAVASAGIVDVSFGCPTVSYPETGRGTPFLLPPP